MNIAARATCMLLLATTGTTSDQEWDGRRLDSINAGPNLPQTTTTTTTSTSYHGDQDVPSSDSGDESSSNSIEINEHLTKTSRESDGQTDTFSTTINAAAPPTQTTAASCYCKCHTIETNRTLNPGEQIQKLKVQTTTQRQHTSAHKMSLVSANDPRPSTQYIGAVATAIMVAVCGMIVIPDVITCFRYICIGFCQHFLVSKKTRVRCS